jgi:hypothetical protein
MYFPKQNRGIRKRSGQDDIPSSSIIKWMLIYLFYREAEHHIKDRKHPEGCHSLQQEAIT